MPLVVRLRFSLGVRTSLGLKLYIGTIYFLRWVYGWVSARDLLGRRMLSIVFSMDKDKSVG